MKVIDLFAGLGGFSQAFRDRGHRVITVDNNPDFSPELCVDVRDLLLHYPDLKADVIVASPPCDEFSRESMPWSRTGQTPSTELVKETERIIDNIKPRFWVVENVRGSVKYIEPVLGKVRKRVGSRYLWGEFPPFDCKPVYGKWKLPPRKDRKALRSKIPYSLSMGLCLACEFYLSRGRW